MFLKSYSFTDGIENGWQVDSFDLKPLNLLVGISGSGKTRVLNTLYNLGTFITKKEAKTGTWNLIFAINDVIYHWQLEADKDKNNEIYIKLESLKKEIAKDNFETIVDRNENKFLFEGKDLPKLTKSESAISLLKEEPAIKDIFNGFQLVYRSDFSTGKLKESIHTISGDVKVKREIGEKKDLFKLSGLLSLNDKLDILNMYFKDRFDKITSYYKQVFPFISELKFQKMEFGPFPNVPIISFKEKDSKSFTPIFEMSSGMQKVLLVLTEICILPPGSIYMIDEYENSLGINAINFFPDFILDNEPDIQFIVTSHHPYIINNIPIQNWYICYRKGQKIKIMYGEELLKRYGNSKQKSFVNLMNDPLYTEGVQ